MNAYKRYQKRKAQQKIAQTYLITEMARVQIYAVMSKPIGFNATEKERNLARVQKACEVAQIAIHTVQQVAKIYA